MVGTRPSSGVENGNVTPAFVQFAWWSVAHVHAPEYQCSKGLSSFLAGLRLVIVEDLRRHSKNVRLAEALQQRSQEPRLNDEIVVQQHDDFIPRAFHSNVVVMAQEIVSNRLYLYRCE